jgi:hypothetical protein
MHFIITTQRLVPVHREGVLLLPQLRKETLI